MFNKRTSKTDSISNQSTLDLDTAAIAYSYTSTKKWAQTFRVSAILKENVDPEILKKAVKKMKDRFPTFFVRLCDGFFWKRFKFVDFENVVITKDNTFCSPVDAYDKNTSLFKIHYFNTRISLDIFHGVTDGYGAMVFLKTLLATYFSLLGYDIPVSCGILDINEQPKRSEIEDGYKKYYDKSKGKISRNESVAYQHHFREKSADFRIKQGIFSASAVKSLTNRYGVSVTEFFAALYAYSFYLNLDDKKFKKHINIQVPINLRGFFPSESLRNFTLYCFVSLAPKKNGYSFEEILDETVKQISRGKEPERLQKLINTNVSDAVMPVSKYSPSFLKQPFIVAGVKLLGERLSTSSISNLGLVKLPKELNEHISYFDFTIGATKLNSIYCGIVTFNDKVSVTLSTSKKIGGVQESFFSFLEEQGIEVEYTV